MAETDFSSMGGHFYTLGQGKVFEDSEEFIQYLYEQEQESREEILGSCLEDKEFLSWLRSLGHGGAVNAWKAEQKENRGERERYIDGLCLLERVAPAKKRRILNLCSQLLKELPEFWLLEHLELYTPQGETGKLLLEQKSDFQAIQGTSAVDFRQLTEKMHQWMESIRSNMLDNYILYISGLYRKEKYELFSHHIDGYFVSDGKNVEVPIGFLKSQKSVASKQRLEEGIRQEIEEAEQILGALDKKVSLKDKYLERLKADVKLSYGRPGRIRSVLGIFIGAAADIHGFYLFRTGVSMQTLFKMFLFALLLLGTLTLLSGIKGFRRCSRWKALEAQIKRQKLFVEKMAQLKEAAQREEALWEQRGELIGSREGFALQQEAEGSEDTGLEKGLKKKTRTLCALLVLLGVWFLVINVYISAFDTPHAEQLKDWLKLEEQGLFKNQKAESADGEKDGGTAIQLSLVSGDSLDWGALSPIMPESIEADSSLVSSSGNYYGPENMADGDTNTSWQEGTDGYGQGQSVHFALGEGVPLKLICVYPGSWRNAENFAKNGRPDQLTVVLRQDGEEKGNFSIKLSDAMEQQCLELSEAIPCNQVEFTIDTVYEGSKYQDTVISEVGFYEMK